MNKLTKLHHVSDRMSFLGKSTISALLCCMELITRSPCSLLPRVLVLHGTKYPLPLFAAPSPPLSSASPPSPPASLSLLPDLRDVVDSLAHDLFHRVEKVLDLPFQLVFLGLLIRLQPGFHSRDRRLR